MVFFSNNHGIFLNFTLPLLLLQWVKTTTMRKGISDGRSATVEFSVKALDSLQSKGYKFVHVIGLTADNHYDYTDPHCLLLVPLKELPTDPEKRDIYEPIESELLYKWAEEINEHPRIVIAGTLLS